MSQIKHGRLGEGRKWFQREEVSSEKPGEESLKAHPESETWLNVSVHTDCIFFLAQDVFRCVSLWNY